MIIGRREAKCSETRHSASLSATNPVWTTLELNPGPRCRRYVTGGLNDGSVDCVRRNY
jgi:hypothetical protein